MTKALILGIGGQDGSYLAEVLLERGYKVFGLYRHSSVNNLKRIEHIKDQITLVQGDILDTNSVLDAIHKISPNEVYNEADQDNVGWSHKIATYSFDITGSAVGRLLDAIAVNYSANTLKFFQPLSATMFGGSSEKANIFNEESKLDPQNPYACAKAFAYHLCKYYREHCGMFVSTGIFFNHDSPLRNNGYLLQKICRQAIEVAKEEREFIELWGDPDFPVDIGYANEYMEAAYKIMQQPKPDDFVIGTGIHYTVEELARYAIKCVLGKKAGFITKLPLRFSQESTEEKNTSILISDIKKAREAFGFNPICHGKRLISLLVRGLSKNGTIDD